MLVDAYSVTSAYASIAPELVPLRRLVLCLRIYTVLLNSLLSLTTQQRRFAATVWSVWNETASAARLSAGHAEDAVAAGSPAVRFVVFCHFCPLVSRDVGEACSLVCPFPRNGGKGAYTEAPTLRLATGAQERIQNSDPPTSADVYYLRLGA